MMQAEIDQFLSQLQQQIKLEFTISFGEIGILLLAFLLFAMKMGNFLTKINRTQRAYRIEHEKEMEAQAQCYKELQKFEQRKISRLERELGNSAIDYRSLERQYKALERHCDGLEKHCDELEKHCDGLGNQYNELERQYNDLKMEDVSESESMRALSPLVSESEDEDEDEDELESIMSLEDEDEDEEEYEDEEEDEDEVERCIWSNKDKEDGTYAHNLPDGFKAYLKSAKLKKTMNLRFVKAEDKANDRWIVDETRKSYKSINQARDAFFGNSMKKQSVWLHTRSAKDGRSLREVIEG